VAASGGGKGGNSPLENWSDVPRENWGEVPLPLETLGVECNQISQETFSSYKT